ncbi:MAG: insulinase family protein [Bacteroidetes bacterium]|nr:MAG: insulinase family protein [Bacteroidota bacterium]
MQEIHPNIISLNNGIRVVFEHRDSFVAHMGVMILSGSRFEGPGEDGLAHFVEHCIFKGTKKRNSIQIVSDLDKVGGELNAYTNKEELCVYASFRRQHFDIAADLLSDIVKNADFPEEEIEKEKDVVLDEILSYEDSPVDNLIEDFEALLFKDHPLGENILGSKKSVKSFTRKQILNFVHRLFVPERMVISVVGNFEVEALKSQLEEYFGSIKGKDNGIDVVAPKLVKPFKVLKKNANSQVHYVLGGIAPSYNDDERRLMALLINYLGGPASNSKLSLLIREERGYAYNIEGAYSSYSDSGFWTIYLGTDRKYLKECIQLVRSELDKVIREGIPAEELEQSKEQLKGHIALSLDSNLELMFSHAKNILIHNEIDSIVHIHEIIDSIDGNDIKEFAARVFDPNKVSELTYDIPFFKRLFNR